MPYIDIILIALVAAFLALRLRAVLGRRNEGERRPDAYTPPAGRGDDNVIDLPRPDPPRDIAGDLPRGADVVSSGASAGLTQIKLADQGFDPRGFVQGARAAFEMIVSAFAAGDTKTLRPLLADSVFANFASAIKQREEAKETLETTLVGFESSEIVAAEMRGTEARVTVRFVSEQINVTRNAEKLIVDGNPNEVTKVTDVWTFARDTQTDDPNWQLVATDSQG